MSKRPLLFGCSLLLLAAVACASSPTDRETEEDSKSDTSKVSPTGDDDGDDGDDKATIGGDDKDPDAKPEGPPEIWGHSSDTLYKVDPTTKAVTVVGKFSGGCDAVIDIALDEDSNMVGTTQTAFFSIDKASAKCTEIAKGTYPTSLSFVPKGTVDDKEEALVGFEDDVYVRIDKVTGKKSSIGSIGGGYLSSGDIVSVKGGSTYLTVKAGPKKGKKAECDDADCLLEIDPSNGKLLKNLGTVDHKQVFGLTFWGGELYGFANDGSLFQITVGSSLKMTALTIPDAPDKLSFWGAGSSTAAPLVVK